MIYKINESWNEFFNENSPLVDDIFRKIIKSNDYPNIYPVRQQVFRVFEMPLNKIKVVILGQDPYPRGEAIGLAFAINDFSSKPASFRNIEKEVGHSLEKDLRSWVNQGVFLLNTALTVRKSGAGSHLELWKSFTVNLIRYIADKNPSIWMLWGKHAQNFAPIITASDMGDKNTILMAAHPAAESYKKDAGFFGCGHFEKASILLSNTINF